MFHGHAFGSRLIGGISGYKEMLNVIKEDPDSDEAWEYYTWLGSKWNVLLSVKSICASRKLGRIAHFA